MPSLGLALLQLVETDAEHAGDQLQPDVLLAVLLRPGVGGDRLAASLRELPVGSHLVDQRVREALLVGSGRRCGRARLAGHDQAEDPVLAAEALEREDLLVHPARLRGGRRTDDDLKRGLLQRSRQGLAEIGRRRQLVAVTKHRRESLGNGTERGLGADEVLRHGVGLERLVQPLGPVLVAMAVADEGAVLEFGIHSSRSKRTAGRDSHPACRVLSKRHSDLARRPLCHSPDLRRPYASASTSIQAGNHVDSPLTMRRSTGDRWRSPPAEPIGIHHHRARRCQWQRARTGP